MKTKKKKYPIPNDIMVPALNQTLVRFAGYCTDNWGEKEATFCRDLLPEEYKYIESDIIRQQCTYLRKNSTKFGVLSVNGGSKRRKYIPPNGLYGEYLKSDYWRLFRIEVLEFWGWQCCLCKSNKRLEVHHNTYDRIGKEKLTDCVALCHKCHMRIHGVMVNTDLANNAMLNDEAEKQRTLF